jgi:hypothetical protein
MLNDEIENNKKIEKNNPSHLELSLNKKKIEINYEF